MGAEINRFSNSESQGYTQIACNRIDVQGSSPRSCDGPCVVGHPKGCTRVFKQTGEIDIVVIPFSIQDLFLVQVPLLFLLICLFLLGIGLEWRHESIVRDLIAIRCDQKRHLSN